VMNADGAGPKLLPAGRGRRNLRGAIHSRRLRGIDVELVGVDHAHPVEPPFRFVRGRHLIAPIADRASPPAPASSVGGRGAPRVLTIDASGPRHDGNIVAGLHSSAGG